MRQDDIAFVCLFPRHGLSDEVTKGRISGVRFRCSALRASFDFDKRCSIDSQEEKGEEER